MASAPCYDGRVRWSAHCMRARVQYPLEAQGFMTEQTVFHLPRAVLSCPRALTAEDIAWAFGSTLSVLANEEQGIFLVDHPLLAVVFKEVSPEPHIDGGAATPTSSARSYEVVECNYSGPAGLRQALEFLAVSTGGVLEIDGESINAAGAAYDLAESAWFVAHADNPHEVVFVDEQGIHLRDKDGLAIGCRCHRGVEEDPGGAASGHGRECSGIRYR